MQQLKWFGWILVLTLTISACTAQDAAEKEAARKAAGASESLQAVQENS